MLKKIIIVIVFVLAVFGGIVAMQPADFNVSRSTTMAAAPAVVFEEVNTLPKWHSWSPWAKIDPNAVTTFEGPEAGKGAVMRWKGNHEVGEGSMTIIESRPAEVVTLRLDFVKPFEGTNTSEFTFEPEGENTLVTWTMRGHNNFIGKALSLVIDCQKMIGEKFDEGLASLKKVVEAK